MIRVLIVDNSHVIRRSLRSLLSAMPGIEVGGTAADSAEALVLITHQRPHLVLMDLRMPNMHGLRALRLIRKRHESVRVLVMSATCGEEVEARCLAAGAHGFLRKQDLSRDLEGHIARLFPRRSSHDSALKRKVRGNPSRSRKQQ